MTAEMTMEMTWRLSWKVGWVWVMVSSSGRERLKGQVLGSQARLRRACRRAARGAVSAGDDRAGVGGQHEGDAGAAGERVVEHLGNSVAASVVPRDAVAFLYAFFTLSWA